jgi:hypothetical protein
MMQLALTPTSKRNDDTRKHAMHNILGKKWPRTLIGAAVFALLILRMENKRAASQETDGPPARFHENDKQKASRGQLADLGKAILKYEKANGRFPPRAIFDKSGKPLLSWRVLILPYLGQEELFKQFKLDEPWDSPHNKALIARMPAVFRNPNDPAASTQTNYLAPVGTGTIFEGTEGIERKKLAHAAQFTVLLVEANRDAEVDWTKPQDLPYTREKPGRGLFHYRPDGFLAAMADGHSVLFTRSSDIEMLRFVFAYAARQDQ